MKTRTGYIVRHDKRYLGRHKWIQDIKKAKIYNSTGKAIYESSLVSGFIEDVLNVEILKITKDSKGIEILEVTEMFWYIEETKKLRSLYAR